MLLLVLYLFGFLTQHYNCSDVDESTQVEVPLELEDVACVEETEDLSLIFPEDISQYIQSDELAKDDVDLESDNDDTSDDDDLESDDDDILDDAEIENDDDEMENYDDEMDIDDTDEFLIGEVSFAGPVKAKGSVLVGATYGYDSPFSPIHFPRPNPNPVFYPLPSYPPLFVPFHLNHGPLITMFLQDLSKEHLENILEDSSTERASQNFLQRGEMEDLQHNPNNDYEFLNDGVIFGGFLPASGKVTVAARF